MARSHATRRLATLAAAGTLAGLASIAAAGSASAASSPTAPAPTPATTGTVCVVPSVNAKVSVQGDTCTVIVVHHHGLLTDILDILL